jgi:hypothetical protein
MSELIFNFRIGKLHIQINERKDLILAINNYHKWLNLPFLHLYEFRFFGLDYHST